MNKFMPIQFADMERMREQFGEPPWIYVVDVPQCWPEEALEHIQAVMLGNKKFVPEPNNE